MKRWIKALTSLLSLLMLLLAVACTPQDNTPDDTPSDSDLPSDSVGGAGDETPAPAPIDIFKDGATEYKLIFDDKDTALAELVYQYVDGLKSKYGITLEAIKASKATQVYEKEIIVGQVRPAAEDVAAKMKKTGDFAMCMVEDDWVLCATDEYNYRYLFDLISSKTAYRPKNGNLSLSSAQDYVYHASEDAEKSYAAYLKQKGMLTQERLVSLFSYGSTTLDDGKEMVYRLYLPSNYTETKNYPLLVLLHGAGERGNDNEKHMCYMLRAMFNHKDSPLMDAIILVPQCPNGQQWVDTPWASGNYSTERVKESAELAGVLNIVDNLTLDYMIDEDRIYAMGLSMGGFGTWDLLMRHSDIFAAGVPICGGGDPTMAEQLVNVPIYTFHGSNDTTVPVAGTREMAQALENAGSTVFTYEELAGMSHGIWETVAEKADVIKWLFEQSLTDR